MLQFTMADKYVYLGLFVVCVLVALSPPCSGALFDQCISDDNCTDINGFCNGGGQCVCNDATQFVNDASCDSKVAAGSSCPVGSIAPCLDLQATCQNAGTVENPDYICTCNTGLSESGGICVTTDCGQIPSSAVTAGSATLTSTTTTYESTATVVCNTGYESTTTQITCQDTGDWSTALCTIRNCGSDLSSAVTGGSATLTVAGVTTYQSTAIVACPTGYIRSATQITCQADGQWSPATCTIRDCGQNPSSYVTSGTATPTSDTTTYGSKADVNCPTGYTPSTTQITCQASGQWSTATCSSTGCNSDASSAVTNGDATTSGTTTGSTANVVCITGYTSSTAQITCQANGQWTTAECTITDCGSNPSSVVTNGGATPGASTTYGSTATVNCPTGYTPSTAQITCGENGQWSAATCTINNCGPNPSSVVVNGGATLTSPGATTYESTATVNCPTGYTPSTTQITCQASGQWSAATCTIKDCGSDLSSTVTFGSATLTTPSTTTYLSTADVTCITGYTSTTTTRITCQATGDWSTVVCARKDCGSNPSSAVTNGGATPGSTTTYESTASVNCQTGYTSPTTQITCQDDGQWSTAACTIRNCGSPLPSTVTNGSPAQGGTTTYGSTIDVNCQTGYTSSTTQITCQANGLWTTAECTIRNCGTLSNPANGQVNFGLTTYQATATYTCNTGYIITGTASDTSTTRTCRATGAWSGGNPSCSIKADPLGAVCPNPANTNLSPTLLCNGDNALCLRRSTGSADFTCQCNTEYYDDNGNGVAGNCKSVTELGVQAITFTSVTTSSMVVTWAPPTGKAHFVDSYMVDWREKDKAAVEGSSPALSVSTYTISSGLTPGQAYTVRVITKNVVNYSSTDKTTSVTKEQALKPQTPGSIKSGEGNLDAEDQTIQVVWTGSGGVVLRYEWQLLEGNTVLQSGNTNTASAFVSYGGFKNGYRYNMAITAVSQEFDGSNVLRSDTYTEEIKTVVKAPLPPSMVQCHMSTDSSLTIKWLTPQLPNGDLVEYEIDTYEYSSNSYVKTDMTGSVGLQYEITGLQPGSYYYFNVLTVNEAYTSISSARLKDAFCATRANVSEAPNNLNVTDIQSRSFVVSWKKPTRTYGENMGYIVQVRTADDACVMELIRTCTGCTQTFNPSSLENMCPDTVSSTVQQSKATIDSDAAQTYSVTGLNPDIVYTVTVSAVNAAGRGRVAELPVQTDEEVPQMPKDVTVVDLTPTSCNVTWSIDGPRPGDTMWEVIVNPVLPVIYESVQLTGFDKRKQALGGLQEYWNYTVTVRATTSKGSKDSGPIGFITLPAAPGPVDAFDVVTTSGGSTVQVEWKVPVLLERNSEIASFNLFHNTTSDGIVQNTQPLQFSRNPDDNFVYQVVLNVTPEVNYQFKVYAINTGAQNGQESVISKEAPAGIPVNTFEDMDNKEVIQADTIVSSQTTLKLSIDNAFYNQNSQGSVILTGLIGCANDMCSENEIGETMTFDQFNRLDNWNTASTNGYTRYRITPDTWRNQLTQKRRKRQANANTEEYIVGSEVCNSTTQNQYCNGPLQPATSYIIHVVICTSGGCLISNEYGPFITLQVPPDDDSNTTVIIVAAVVSVVVIAIIVLVIGFVIMRRKKSTPKMTRMEPEATKIDEIPTTQVERKRPILLKEFEGHLNFLHKDSNLKFSEAYEDLRSLAPSHPQEAANLEENRLKNRYINILPFDHSRVKLFSNGEEENSDYINANYLPGYRSPREYIGCQGPIPGTIDDFWRMVWEQKVSIIVMLTLCKEGQKVKCEQYWPEENREPKQYGDVVVEVTSTSTIQTYVMRIFKITNGGKSRTIKHFHFLSWLDFQANVKHDIILDFITHVRSHVQPPDTAGPMIVHCSAGVGRTGTYVCLDHLMQFIDEHDFDVTIDIFDMVLQLRENRPLMVQTEQQYVFIHDCVKELMDRKRKSMENIYENQGFSTKEEEDLYQNTQEPSLYENLQMKTEL